MVKRDLEGLLELRNKQNDTVNVGATCGGTLKSTLSQFIVSLRDITKITMKPHLLLASVLLFLCSTLDAQVVFDGSPLTSYIGQTVTFDQTLYVCGRYGHNLYLSYERMRLPEEVTIFGTTAYDSAQTTFSQGFLTAYCPNISTDTIRSGASISQLSAAVTGERNLQIYSPITIANNQRPTHRPDVGDARLIVCGANLEYYCPDWQGTYGAESDEEFAVQHTKLMKALLNIDADLYAFAEIQQGSIALDSIVRGLNSATAPSRYSFVTDGDTIINSYTKVGFVYRSDKVVPILSLGHPYGPASNTYGMRSGYHRREYVQAFEELSTAERFIVSMNHFKSKSGGDSTNNFYNANRMENAEHLTYFLEAEQDNNYYQDPDILILGDLNCGTMEEPIRFLESSGYTNLMHLYAPDQYSYTYRNGVEYLDHALASSSLVNQVTGAQPYHINADESYYHYYPYGDTSMYRYSDHDPLIVGLNLHSTPVTECQDYHYNESFAYSLGCFTAQSTIGDSYWYTYDNYECACANGYYSGANEDWLVSPTFDFSNKDNIQLSFRHTLGYGTPSTYVQHCHLMISNNYAGDVRTATWEELPIPNIPSYAWGFEENILEIPEPYRFQNQVTIAFKYTVDENDIPAWEIKDFALHANCRGDSTSVAQHTQVEPIVIYSSPNTLHIQCATPQSIMIYDVLGRTIAQEGASEQHVISLPAGVYLARIGWNSVKKVIVR